MKKNIKHLENLKKNVSRKSGLRGRVKKKNGKFHLGGGGTFSSLDPVQKGGSNLKAVWKSHLTKCPDQEDPYHAEFASWHVTFRF